MIEKPSILFVDDEADTLQGLKQVLNSLVSSIALYPHEVTLDDLTGADLVLVDLQLDHWPERDRLESIALQPANGLALTAVLRSHVEFRKHPKPTAFAILTGRLADLVGNQPAEQREHAIARSHNLEWAFAKQSGEQSISLEVQIASLAHAVKALPQEWPIREAIKLQACVSTLLNLPIASDTSVWASRAWDDVVACHPPLHELVQDSNGLAFLHWMLHRILPYPCFLWDLHWLAARLRVSYRSLSQQLTQSSQLYERLDGFRYKGILEDFLGQRWWRSAAEAFVWELTDGNPFDPEAIHSALIQLTGAELELDKHSQPIVCVDSNYRPLHESVSIDNAVRIQPDDWPSYADEAWTTIELARNDDLLSALVIDQDRSKLG